MPVTIMPEDPEPLNFQPYQDDDIRINLDAKSCISDAKRLIEETKSEINYYKRAEQ